VRFIADSKSKPLSDANVSLMTLTGSWCAVGDRQQSLQSDPQQRSASSPTMSLLLSGAEAQSSAKAYRLVPHTPVEQQAQAGTLPHMRRRWFICGVLSTALWGALFGMLAAAAWMRT
jgi:hypothetical protein